MKINLSQILESTVLLEGRKEDAIKKYGEEHEGLITTLSQADPSGNNKYLDWMIKTALGKSQDNNIPTVDYIVRVVGDFHKQLARIKNKDINSYKSIAELNAVVDEAKAKEEEKKVAKQAKKVYEDDTIVVYAPFTVQASCKYGAGSKWCIAGGTSGNYNTYFDSYSNHSNFYFLINKKMSAKSNPVDYKYALQWRFDGTGRRDKTWWDAQDNSHDNPPSWVTPEVMKAIEDFEPKHKKIKLGSQAKAFLEDPQLKDYTKFSDIITPEQKTMVINKIIERGSLNSNTFRILSPDLSDEQKMKFITEYVKGNVSSSDYLQMVDNLNGEQTLTLLKFNPSILNNYGIMKDINEKFSDEDKYNLAKSMDGKEIHNTDSKVLFRKWSMTAEDRKKHAEKSFYVYLSSPNSDIEKLVKVDSLDPDSYRTINMMKIRKQTQSGVDMYGIKTEGGLLDEYTGLSSSDIPEDVLSVIKEKANKI